METKKVTNDLIKWIKEVSLNEDNGHFNITFNQFKENEDGKYDRYDEAEREKMYTLASIKKMLAESALEFIGAYSDFVFSSADDEDERLYIVARCKK